MSNCGMTRVSLDQELNESGEDGGKNLWTTQQKEETFTKVWFLKLWLDPVGNMKALWTEVEKPTTIPAWNTSNQIENKSNDRVL